MKNRLINLPILSMLVVFSTAQAASKKPNILVICDCHIYLHSMQMLSIRLYK